MKKFLVLTCSIILIAPLASKSILKYLDFGDDPQHAVFSFKVPLVKQTKVGISQKISGFWLIENTDKSAVSTIQIHDASKDALGLKFHYNILNTNAPATQGLIGYFIEDSRALLLSNSIQQRNVNYVFQLSSNYQTGVGSKITSIIADDCDFSLEGFSTKENCSKLLDPGLSFKTEALIGKIAD